jgi:hypothetical protein
MFYRSFELKYNLKMEKPSSIVLRYQKSVLQRWLVSCTSAPHSSPTYVHPQEFAKTFSLDPRGGGVIIQALDPPLTKRCVLSFKAIAVISLSFLIELPSSIILIYDVLLENKDQQKRLLRCEKTV